MSTPPPAPVFTKPALPAGLAAVLMLHLVHVVSIGGAGSHLPLWSNSTFGGSGNEPSGITPG